VPMNVVLYDNFKAEIGRVTDWVTATVKIMLCSSSYTPAQAHDKRDDITNEIVGAGYTAGGQSLTSKAIVLTAANSWAQAWAASTAYKVGDIVRPSTGNTHVYICVEAGTSGGSAPTWPTVRFKNVTDGSVVWCEIGVSVASYTADNPSWPGLTAADLRYAVLYKSLGGASSADPLIGYGDMAAQALSGINFSITWNAAGAFVLT
jgi:hypothetical protein